MLPSFLLIVGQNSRYCSIRKTFGRSKYTISQSFSKILKALNIIATNMMTKLGSTMKIKDCTRFFTYQKVSDDDDNNIISIIGVVVVFFFFVMILLSFSLLLLF